VINNYISGLNIPFLQVLDEWGFQAFMDFKNIFMQIEHTWQIQWFYACTRLWAD